MKAGRELDDLMATEVMEWELLTVGYFGGPDETPRQVELEDWLEDKHPASVGRYWIDVPTDLYIRREDWKPSTDIVAAWPLHLAICGASFTERHDYLLALGPTICERFRKEAVPPLGEHESIDWPWLLSALEPVDICVAALKAKGIDVDT